MSLKHNLESLQEIAKERTVKTQSIEYDLETLVKKIKKGVIKLDPEYQRRHRWNSEYSSRLIESLILNIPIPIIYLSYDIDVDTEEEGSRFSVIDGQQRLTAIVNFFENKFTLKGLDILTDLEGFSYKHLPPFLIRRLEERSIKCLRIDSTMDPQVKFDIFERLNSGAVKLEPHELRNATQRGPFNDLCKKLSKNSTFRKLAQIPVDEQEAEENPKVKKMEDVELVLRFFALSEDSYKTYKKTKGRQFKDFLTERLAELNKKSPNEIAKLEKRFISIIKCIHENFGDTAFAKYKFNPDNKSYELQSNFNAAVYDALIIGYSSEISDNNCVIDKKHVSKFRKLFSDDDFYESVSGSILDSAKIVTRITKARAIFS
jgi:hypothetical protein